MSASTQVRSPLRRHSRPLIGLCVFLVVCLALIWTVFVTLQREVDGETHSYSAVFTDVSGLKVGDEVRMAGVKVGRVDDVALDGTQARVQFRVQSEQVLYGNTKASIVYQNIIGQRYLGLSLADYGDPSVLPAGAVIPVEHTEPSFDISKLLNGFEPLSALLSPEQVDNLTMAIVRSLQGDTGAIATMISETTRLASPIRVPTRFSTACLPTSTAWWPRWPTTAVHWRTASSRPRRRSTDSRPAVWNSSTPWIRSRWWGPAGERHHRRTTGHAGMAGA